MTVEDTKSELTLLNFCFRAKPLGIEGETIRNAHSCLTLSMKQLNVRTNDNNSKTAVSTQKYTFEVCILQFSLV